MAVTILISIVEIQLLMALLCRFRDISRAKLTPTRQVCHHDRRLSQNVHIIYNISFQTINNISTGVGLLVECNLEKSVVTAVVCSTSSFSKPYSFPTFILGHCVSF